MPEICGSSRKSGVVVKLTNLSGTFQFDDVDGQRDLASELRAAGLSVALGKVRLFPHDGGSPVIVHMLLVTMIGVIEPSIYKS